jgi:putative oxidoreductase
MSQINNVLSAHTTTPQSGYAALVLRLTLGTALLAHGLLKLLVFTLPGTVGFFASVGFPGWLAYPAVALEVVGGALLVLGLYVRPVAVVAIVELLGAASVHLGNGWVFSNPKGGWEYPVFLAATALAVALAGEGRYALRLSAPSADAPSPAAA